MTSQPWRAAAATLPGVDARSGPEVLAAIDRVAKTIRSEAAPSERLRRASPRLVDALHRERLFRLWIPQPLNGDELDLVDSLRAFEAVAHIDGSAGWTVMIGVGGGLFAAFMSAEGARDVFRRPDALVAGSGSPKGRAVVEAGGYRAGGEWAYASGAHQATTFTANCIVERDGQTLLDAEGKPLIRAMAFPAESVAIVKNWEVLGMRGTGSHDFRVPPVFVPASHTFSVFTDSPRETGPLYHVPFASIAELSFGAVALGIGLHAMEAFTRLAETKPLYGSSLPMATNASVKAISAEAAALVRVARERFYDAAAATWASVLRGGTVPVPVTAEAHLASVHAARSSTRAVDMVFELARTAVVRDGDELGRAWRDVHVLRQHAALSPI